MADSAAPLVGADADCHHRLQGLLQPRPQGLSQQGNRGYEEQHQTAAPGFVFGDSQRGEGFARAAGHDEFAAIFSLEMLMKDRNSLLLMRTRRLFVLTGF